MHPSWIFASRAEPSWTFTEPSRAGRFLETSWIRAGFFFTMDWLQKNLNTRVSHTHRVLFLEVFKREGNILFFSKIRIWIESNDNLCITWNNQYSLSRKTFIFGLVILHCFSSCWHNFARRAKAKISRAELSRSQLGCITTKKVCWTKKKVYYSYPEKKPHGIFFFQAQI